MGCSVQELPGTQSSDLSTIADGSNTDLSTETIPSSLFVTSPGGYNLPRSQFGNITRWYREPSNNVQYFNLWKDEYIYRSDGVTKHCRVEAHSGLNWHKSSAMHVLELSYYMNNTIPIDVCIAQLFEGSSGPQLMVHFRSNGNLDVGSRGNGMRVISSENWTRRNFTIKITMQNETMKVYLNGVEKFSGPAEQRNNANANYHFRWGLYCNYQMPESIGSSVWNVTRY